LAERNFFVLEISDHTNSIHTFIDYDSMPPTPQTPYVCLRCSFRQLQKRSIPAFHRQFTSNTTLRNSSSQIALPLPSFAPKPSLDIKHIRNNVALHEKNCKDRNYPEAATYPSKIESLFSQWKDIQTRAEKSRRALNGLQKTIGHMKASSEDEAEIENLLNQAKKLRNILEKDDSASKSLDSEINSLAFPLPNLASPSTPIGNPKLLSYINYEPTPESSSVPPPPKNPSSLAHTTIGSNLNLLDFTFSSHTSGWGFYFLLNGAALLEQALISYALHTCAAAGFKPTAPPSLTYTHLAHLTGFQPRNASSQIFTISQPPDTKTPSRSLSATAEIPLAGSKARSTLTPSQLPLKMCAHSRCYRAEAGARGVDTKGLYRVHEFSKVEMFAWTAPTSSASDTVFNEMVALQTAILQSLDLKCRVLEMPSHDLGASAYRKIDIEAFFPSRAAAGIDGGWGEVTSASICTDYQSRRLETRLKDSVEGNGFPYTLNGTALAVPRVIAAIMENGYDEVRGVVRIPEVLWKFMPGGMEEIGDREKEAS
jgi:seryl-tRNA synthetase